MAKKVKKKIKFKIVPILIFLICLVVLYFGLSYLADTKIKNIYVYGNNLLTDQEVIELKIRKSFFNVLNIYITEYKPLFIKGDKLILEGGISTDIVECKVPVLTNEVDNDVYNDFIKEMLKLKSSVRGQISDGNHVYVNIAKFSKLNYYDEIYPTLNNKKGTLYLDSGNHFEVF